MEFLKTVLGDALYAQVEEKINAHNGDEANKEKQIKIGNLGGGEYVGKGKYDADIEKLNELLSGKDNDIQSLTATLNELKQGKVDAETLQSKLAEAERLLTESKEREAQTRVKYALRDALRGENAIDVDYLEYLVEKNLRDDGKTLELDENEHIKGWDDIIGGLKTQAPQQFPSGTNGRKVFGESKLPDGDPSPVSVSREEFAKMGYNDRLKLKQENEPLFRNLVNGNI